ncbi:MAG: glycosyltransferase family 2 protein [Bacteroidales bacterium]|jgi:glycosyltransferase involved in cell wall biosynthesis
MISASIVIITLNEERNIERCLNSVKDISDDIIVVDSYSNDKTKEICKKYDVNFIEYDWKGYSETKNYGNSIAKYDWILSIDADEVVSEKLKKSLLNVDLNSGFDGFYLKRLNNYCGKWIKHSGWYPDRKIRLWNKNKAKWEGEVHEKIVLEKQSEIGCLKGNLLHYSYYTIKEHIKRIEKYSDMSAQEYFKKGKKSNIFKIYVAPVFKFILNYFIRLGFLDGYYGFIICKLTAYTTFLKYYKLKKISNIEH